jgi:hypothetical protein
MKVDRVKKPYSRRRDITASKINRNSSYEKLRNSPLYYLDEEEFKFVIRLLLGENQ